MASARVVPAVDPGVCAASGVVDRREHVPVVALVLEGRSERLRRGIVPADPGEGCRFSQELVVPPQLLVLATQALQLGPLVHQRRFRVGAGTGLLLLHHRPSNCSPTPISRATAAIVSGLTPIRGRVRIPLLVPIMDILPGRRTNTRILPVQCPRIGVNPALLSAGGVGVQGVHLPVPDSRGR